MNQLIALKSAMTLNDVAGLLGFKASALSFILYRQDITTKYKKFEMPKSYGGVRTICAPVESLKLLQRRLADVLEGCIEVIKAESGVDDKASHGFVRGRSIVTNARIHRHRRFVLNVDIEDFFGTINFGRVRGFFIKDKRFQLNERVATILAQIACYESVLPQGSPCSPVLSNLVGHILDVHLVRLAADNGCTYSRYADDLTFSTNKQEFPSMIAMRDEKNPHLWIAGSGLTRIVEKSWFKLNPLKTRMQYRDSRQEVTGLVVNKRVNVRVEYRHLVRAMVHRLVRTGTFEYKQIKIDESGQAIEYLVPGTMNQLQGMLGFINGIDAYNEKVPNGVHSEKNVPSRYKEHVYRRFLLFKDFYSAPSPVLICEGKTDNVYLVHAIRSLALEYPKLASVGTDGRIRLLVRLYKYADTNTGRTIGIRGGAGDLGNLIGLYHSELKRFTAPGKLHPVILLIDNDDAVKSIRSRVRQLTGQEFKVSDSFVRVTGNLYVANIPLVAGASSSTIEDYFDSETRSTIVDGKTFSSDKNFDQTLFFGKEVFAHKVVKENAEKIDFSGFQAVLSVIDKIIETHTKIFPSP